MSAADDGFDGRIGTPAPADSVFEKLEDVVAHEPAAPPDAIRIGRMGTGGSIGDLAEDAATCQNAANYCQKRYNRCLPQTIIGSNWFNDDQGSNIRIIIFTGFYC